LVSNISKNQRTDFWCMSMVLKEPNDWPLFFANQKAHCSGL